MHHNWLEARTEGCKHPKGACSLRAQIFGRCAGMHWPCADFIKAAFVQVLFCSLTGDQRDLYRAYISSEEVQDILNVSICSIACVHIMGVAALLRWCICKYFRQRLVSSPLENS